MIIILINGRIFMDSASEIMNRIKQVANDLGMSGREFSASIEQSNSYLSAVPKKGIGSDVLTKIIIRYPQYNVNWLLTGKGEMLIEEKESDNSSASLFKIIESQQEIIASQQRIIEELSSKKAIVHQESNAECAAASGSDLVR